MVVAEFENLRIRVRGAVNSAFNEFVERKRMSKQDAIEGMLTWLLAQDDLVQSMVLGQVRADPDLVAYVLAKLAGDAAAHANSAAAAAGEPTAGQAPSDRRELLGNTRTRSGEREVPPGFHVVVHERGKLVAPPKLPTPPRRAK
jgi:hypothetical protein